MWLRCLLCLFSLCAVSLVAADNQVVGHVSQSAPLAKRLMLIGPPGSGKGALAAKLSASEGLPVLTMSHVLRYLPQSSPLKSKVDALMASGVMVPDDVVVAAVSEELSRSVYNKGVILDGFPRNVAQAEFFEKQGMSVDLVVVLLAKTDVLVKRVSGRRVHEPSGRVYHVDHMPPKVAGLDDVTGEPLVQRSDDTASVVRKRLDDYYQITEPVAAWALFHQQGNHGVIDHVVFVDANASFAETWSQLCYKTATEGVTLKGCVA